MSEFDGQVWAIQEGDTLALVCAVRKIKKKVQVLNERGREQSLGEDKLFWAYPGKASSAQDWQDKQERLQSDLSVLRNEVDVGLLWETAQEMETSDIGELAELYFGGEIDSSHRIALWQALADDRLHFKRKGKEWEIRSAEQVEEMQLQRAREQERLQMQTLATEWLQGAIQADTPEVGEDIAFFVERLETWMRGDQDKDVDKLVRDAADQAKLSPRELVFDILQKTGRLPEDADRDVIIAGLKPEFSAPVLEAAAAVQPWLADAGQNLVELDFSIDDPDTREIDDALSLSRDGEHWLVRIAIADPASVIHAGDALDREAMRRGTTVYLPTQTVLMLPERISCELASLNADTPRSSIITQVRLSDTGEIIDYEIVREAVRVAQRLDYKTADRLMAEGDDDSADKLRQLQKLAALRQQARLAEGALNFNRPEYKISVDRASGKVSVGLIERDSPSRAMIAEMMILANHLAGKYAHLHQVPLIFRTQEAPVEPIPLEAQQDPVAFQKVRRLLKPSALSLHPGAHSGLGLSVYTQCSSPLRRFADLVMQRQLLAHLAGEPLAYDQEELFQVLATAEHTAREAKITENEAKKRWFVHYLKQDWLEKDLEVMIMDNLKAGYRVELQPWGVDAFLGAPPGLEVGQRVTARVDKLRPKAGQIRLKRVAA